MTAKATKAKGTGAGGKSTAAVVYQLKITLTGTKPPIWRRIQVPATIKLADLHDVLQVALGWTNSHLHQFEQAGQCWGMAEHEELEESDESRMRLNKLLKAPGDKMKYTYDFGDDWRYTVVLEKILPGAPMKTAQCVGGARCCPPEDVGGVYGYYDFVEALSDPAHERHEERLEWAGDFDPEAFDVNEVNAVLARMRVA